MNQLSDEARRERLFDRLRSLGVSDDELAEHGDDLAELELVFTMWPGERKHTVGDMAAALGVSAAELVEIRVNCGFAEPDPSTRVGTDKDVEFYRMVLATRQIFGDAETLQLVRTIGSSVARIADAATTAFLVAIELPFRNENRDDSETTNPLAGELVGVLEDVVLTLMRKHFVSARRSGIIGTVGDEGYEIMQQAVGFIDLAGSTEIAERLGFGEIAELLGHFEELVTSIVTRYGGRVIKLIGDEVLFAANDPAIAARIGFAVADAVEGVETMPAVRVGIAAGEVLIRVGDVFGPPVNRAARIVKKAEPGTVLVTPVIRAAASSDFVFEAAGEVDLPGFSTSSELWRLGSPRRDVTAEPDTGELE